MKKIIGVFVFMIVLVFVIIYFYPKDNSITYAKDIAPIIYKNCTPCHRLGAQAPFLLQTYNDVVRRGKLIAHVVDSRIMPPWPADPDYSHFVGEKFLSKKEIELIKNWVEAGMPAGDLESMPEAPKFPDNSKLGKPDLVLQMPEPFLVKGKNMDQFYLMKIPFEIPCDTFVKTIEFIPGSKKIVHHVNGHLITYDEAKKKDVFAGKYYINTDSSTYEEGYKLMSIPNDDGTYPTLTPSATNYLPGVEGIIYPSGIGGFKIAKKGAILFKDIHYGPTAIDQIDQSICNIFYDTGPPKRPTAEIQLGTLGISKIEPPLVIPPNTVKTFRTQTTVPMDISLLTINPHMHLLGKSFLAYAIKPTGDTIPLIRINKWDFRWQYFYTFKKMLKIPKGSVIKVEGIYDNTSGNPNNPFNPPEEVGERSGSMRVSDEMFQFIMTYIPYQQGDENISLETQ